MSDIIQLLPDSVANQIAAGEVIQRPASVVKELVENAIDAGSTDIKIIVKDAGRTLIQIVDNGCGMSATDARLSFERHATSKIREANDLYAIRTMGFRGEALASIAAVAQVELKTRKTGDELGTLISLAGSHVDNQEAISCPEGSNFSVKNLFFNVPARRKFLKKDSTELRHIINEFQRIVLANPDVSFQLTHNDMPMFSLPVTNIKQRIVNMVGKNMLSQLVSVETSTVLIKISGFIGKPESARKSAGDQFFFVNQRYMRHPYLHKAVTEPYENLVATGAIPAYFLFIEVDPKIIDINIHPTKTEIKFEDERAIWQIMNATIRESLGKHNMIPTIDFDTAGRPEIPIGMDEPSKEAPKVEVNPFFNPFETNQGVSQESSPSGGVGSYAPQEKQSTQGWEKLYEGFEAESQVGTQNMAPTEQTPFNPFETGSETTVVASAEPIQQTMTMSEGTVATASSCFQLKNRYILTSGKSGLMMIDQRRAHERVLYEQLMASINVGKAMTQQCLYPEQLNFNAEDTMVVKELMPELLAFGLDLSVDENDNFEVKGTPADMQNISMKALIDGILESFKTSEVDLEADLKDRIARSIAKQSAIQSGQVLSVDEMDEIVGQLFTCQVPNYSPDGKTVISILTTDEIETRFK